MRLDLVEEEGLPPLQHLDMLIAEFTSWLVETDFQQGIAISTLVTGLGPAEATVSEALRDNNIQITERYAAYLRRSGVKRPHEVATTILCAFEGSVIYARVRRDTQPLHACAAMLRPLLAQVNQHAGKLERA